ncbi:putative endo alpha- polygalactosaminidase [Rosellinia necatrix]|uniref:alpha-galactosidase n=1 Tax=Rosellinia necatrix TaxID=77044 RepID=A0A1W2TVD7_ROSNE|nr:putative endo alpha- polygalactosaminidase [Rosellinia necatrix]
MPKTGAVFEVQKEAGSPAGDVSQITATSSQHFLTRKKIIIIIITMVGVISLALGLGLGIGLTHASPASPSPSPSPKGSTSSAAIVQPAVGTTWDYPLGFPLTPANANGSTAFYAVDLEDTPAATIGALRAAGHTVACYFSAGSAEAYRADAGAFPAAAVGNTLDGWPDERWLDVRDAGVRAVMSARIRRAAAKGCAGVDPDNVDGYDNDSGFPLAADDAADYVRFLAAEARAAGLAFGLKNAGALVPRVLDVAQWAINEECAAYRECADWAPFIAAGKPVFHVEYVDDDDATTVTPSKLAAACAADGQSGFSTIVKHYTLDNWVVYC